MNKAFEKILEKLEADEKHTFDGCINKRYAKQIVQEVAEEYKDKYVSKDEVGYMLDSIEMRGDETWMDYYRKALKGLCKLTDKEYNGGWIPCSERLPEESGYYLVTYHDWSDGNFLPKYDDTYVRRLHYQISDHFVGWNYPKNVDDRAENDCHKEVIAWQPLPEPFKERD